MQLNREPIPVGGVAVSQRLGRLIAKEGKVIEVDVDAVAEAMSPAEGDHDLQEPPLLVIDRPPMSFAGRAHGVATGPNDRLVPNSIVLGVTRKQIRNGVVSNAATTIAHESQHIQDYRNIGYQRVRFRYLMHKAIIRTSIVGATGLFYIYGMPETTAPPALSLAAEAAGLAAALLVGEQAAYQLNPFERRARRAERRAERMERPLLRFIPVEEYS